MLWIVREHVNEYKCDNTINLTIGLCKKKRQTIKIKRIDKTWDENRIVFGNNI